MKKRERIEIAVLAAIVLIALIVYFATRKRAPAQLTIYPAASCNQSDVLSALNKATASNSLVTIPSGTCTWNATINYTVPSGETIAIQGTTAIVWGGTPGAQDWNCQVNDAYNNSCPSTGSGSTTIIDGVGAGNNLFQINPSGGDACTFTLENLTFVAGTPKNDGVIVTNGSCHNLRWTQVHLVAQNSQSGSRFYGDLWGVIDHSVADLYGNTTSNAFIFSNPIGDNIGYGDGAWARPIGFGSTHMMVMENDLINGGMVEDCDTAGQFALRYSSYYNGTSLSAGIHTHGTKTGSGRGRSCRGYEMYHVYVQGLTGGSGTAVSSNGGPAMIWGNTVGGGLSNFAGGGVPRNDTESNSPTPGSWGYCGTAVNSNGAGAAWDGNQPATTGWPCLDGLGRDQTIKPLNGQNFPNAGQQGCTPGKNCVPFWPQQLLYPIYFFANTLPSGLNEWFFTEQSSKLNRDVYLDNAAFNGTSGTGSGPAKSRPNSCTPGPGGTYGASPTGSYGVAYWETDTQQLDICTGANTWTNAVYKPLPYPHPLDGGSAPPPSTYTLTTSTAGPGQGNISGCAGQYSAGAAYTCTVTAAAGSTISSVAGCGGSGSSTYTGVMPNGNCNVTATFALVSPSSFMLSTATAGPGQGIISGCGGSLNAGAAYSCAVSASPGSTLSGVSGCGGSSTTIYNNSATIFNGTMPSGACTVTATFNTATARKH